MSTKTIFTCDRCGWKWEQGQHGGHDCLNRVSQQLLASQASLTAAQVACAVKDGALRVAFNAFDPIYYPHTAHEMTRALAENCAAPVTAKLEELQSKLDEKQAQVDQARTTRREFQRLAMDKHVVDAAKLERMRTALGKIRQMTDGCVVDPETRDRINQIARKALEDQ